MAYSIADFNQGENKLGIFSEKVGFYAETKTRSVKNFFNSSITYLEDYVKERKPNSKNTLGFDIFSIVVPNYDFEVFPVGNEYLRVNFSSTTDTYYAFLLGLAINTEENTTLRDAEVDKLLGKKPAIKPQTAVIGQATITPQGQVAATQGKTTTTPVQSGQNVTTPQGQVAATQGKQLLHLFKVGRIRPLHKDKWLLHNLLLEYPTMCVRSMQRMSKKDST